MSKPTKQPTTIDETLRYKVSKSFYNVDCPEAYTSDEIDEYERKIDRLMAMFSQELDRQAREIEEEFERTRDLVQGDSIFKRYLKSSQT